MTEGLKQRIGKFTKKLALKFKKIDEKKSISEVESVASLFSAPGSPSKDDSPEPKAEDETKEDPLTSIFGGTAPPENLERLCFKSTSIGISAYRSSDSKKDPSTFDNLPTTASDNK